ncbi:MAG: zinc-dependent metalloprotease [Planctomycetota bacterium]|jgi:hypothetical protein
MQFESSSARRILGGAIVAAAMSPVVVAQSQSLPSPLVAHGPAAGGAGTEVVLDAAAYESLKTAAQVTLTDFALAPGTFVDLELRQVEVISPDAQIVRRSRAEDLELARPDVVLLSGHVSGEPGTTAYIGLSPHGSNGFIQRGGETFVLSSGPAGTAPTIVYSLDALPEGAITWQNWQCMAEELAVVQPNAGAPRGGGGVAGAEGLPCRVIELAVDTDDEFTDNLFGGNYSASAAYIATLFGAVSEIYLRDVGSRFVIVYLRLWDHVFFDPWDANNTTNQLFQFRDYWEANDGDIQRDVAHFLSGRSLGGGVAWLPGLCQPGFAYGLSANMNGFFPYPLEDNNGQNWDMMVVSHELGHNFGAPHTHSHNPQIDNCAGGDCADADQGTIMSYCHTCPGGMSNINLHFHPMIIDDILAYLDNDAPCNLVSSDGADLSGDGAVDIVDVLEMLSSWGACGARICPGDLDCDGEVTIDDLLALLALWS